MCFRLLIDCERCYGMFCSDCGLFTIVAFWCLCFWLAACCFIDFTFVMIELFTLMLIVGLLCVFLFLLLLQVVVQIFGL